MVKLKIVLHRSMGSLLNPSVEFPRTCQCMMQSAVPARLIAEGTSQKANARQTCRRRTTSIDSTPLGQYTNGV